MLRSVSIEREIVGKGLFAGGNTAIVREFAAKIGFRDDLDFLVAIECVK